MYGTNSRASRTPLAAKTSATRETRSSTAGDGGTASTSAHSGMPSAAQRRAIDADTRSSVLASAPRPSADRSVTTRPRSRTRSAMAAASVPARSAARRLNQSRATPRNPAAAAAASTRSSGCCTVAEPSRSRATVAMVAKLSTAQPSDGGTEPDGATASGGSTRGPGANRAGTLAYPKLAPCDSYGTSPARSIS